MKFNVEVTFQPFGGGAKPTKTKVLAVLRSHLIGYNKVSTNDKACFEITNIKQAKREGNNETY